MGSPESPLVLRTYVPDPGLDAEAVLPHHHQGLPTPKYSPGSGRESKSIDKPIQGIPAAIAVNAGPALSYVWDTTECRLLYAWADGFLDMTPYWGDKNSGRRKGFDYVPRLDGILFFKAAGPHPIHINGAPAFGNVPPIYLGHRRETGHPVFRVQAGDRELTISILPGDVPQTLRLKLVSSRATDQLAYQPEKTPVEVLDQRPGRLEVLIRPNAAEIHHGYKSEEVPLTSASIQAGEVLYTNLGCVACHTTDGGANHGPSFKGLAGSNRSFLKHPDQSADDAYIKESILQPGARTVKGFPEGMMPPYPINEIQVESLILFIQSLE